MCAQLFDCLVAMILALAPPTLGAPEARGGSTVLLVAAEAMVDPRFRQTVVLVTRHGRGGSTLGVIVNRPLNVSLDTLFPQSLQAAPHRLHFGGPVAQGQIVYLVRSEIMPSGAIAVGDRLFLASHRESLLRLLDVVTAPARLRVFSGLSSWAPNQLEQEIQRGDWHVLPLDAELLFDDSLEDLWLKLWRRATLVTALAPSLPQAAVSVVGGM